jgi:hypothetical protein
MRSDLELCYRIAHNRARRHYSLLVGSEVSE